MANYQGIVDPAILAQQQINSGNKLTNIGGIVGGIGALADTINAIVQAQRGRIPIPIGAPFQAIGGTIGNFGAQKLAAGQKNTALAGINSINDPAITDGLKQLMKTGINSGYPEMAIKGGMSVLENQPKIQATQDQRDFMNRIVSESLDLKKETEERLIKKLNDSEKAQILPYKKDTDQVLSVQSTLTRLQDNLNKMGDGRLGGLIEKTQGLISNPQLKTYETQKALLLSNISRNLGGEKGVLTDQDVERITAGFPSIYDTITERNAKFGEIQALINTRLEQHVQNGYAINPELADQIFKGTNYNKIKEQQSGQPTGSGPPPGATGTVTGTDGKLYYTDGKNNLGVAQ